MTRHTFGAAQRKPLALIARNPVFQAFARKPMASALKVTQAVDARLAYLAVTQGTASIDDFQTLGSLSNLIMVLTERYCCPDDQAAAIAAQQAVLRAQARWLDGKAWNFDGEGRTAMLRALDIFEDAAERIGQGAVTLALLEIITREKRGQVHTFERQAA